MKSIRAITPLSSLARFLVVFTLGLLILFRASFVEKSLHILIIIALGINSVASFSAVIFHRQGTRPQTIWTGILSLVGMVLMLVLRGVVSTSVSLLVGIWSILVGCVQFIYAIQLIATKQKGFIRFILLGIFSGIVALSLMVNLGQSSNTVRLISGLYLCAYGLWQLADLFSILLNVNIENNAILSRLRVKPPVFLTAMLPSIILKNMRSEYRTLKSDIVTMKPSATVKEWDEYIEVFFHLGNDVAFGFGHVDLCIRDKIYSYGCYNPDSNRFMGVISDGVILLDDRKKYLPFCLNVENKLMIGFTIGITKKTADTLASKVTDILETQCEKWTPNNPQDYAPCANFYLVKTGAYRYYNVLRTNCVAVAEMIVSGTGLKLLPSSGFITPGAYYDFLLMELRDPTSNVVKRTIYAHTNSEV